MKQLSRHIYLALFAILLLADLPVYGQTIDPNSIEAFITDHKKIRSLMITRNAIEQANELLHKKSAKTNSSYKAINDSLDKYTRYFDLIDLVYNSCATVFNVKNTYDDVSSRVQDFFDLNEGFVKFCIEKKSVTASDSIVLNCYNRIVDTVDGDLNGLYTSLVDLIAYASGTATCTTAHLMYIFDNINHHLDHLREVLNREYYIMWKYIRIRMTFWKPAIFNYQCKDRMTICNECIQRWHNARKASLRGAMPGN